MSWERVADADAVDVGTALQVEVGGEPICVVRVDADVVRAVHDVCSHEDYPLHEGWVDDSEIECALHGSTFDLESGAPTCLPAVKPIPTYAAKIQDGGIWVDVDQQLNDAKVPRH